VSSASDTAPLPPFQDRVRRAVGDAHLHEAIGRATTQLQSRRGAAFASLEQAELVRDHARHAKLTALAKLDEMLETFERNLVRNGVQVHWARDGEEACRIVLEIAQRRGAKRAVKAKSMLTEEIHLNRALIAGGVEVLESDLGEYVVQLADDRPSHIILPIVHLTREDVGHVMERTLGVPYTPEPKEICKVARARLREKFLTADLGISGGNFGVVETGSICLVSNEGNIRMSTTLPRVHVALLGIEKLVPTLADLDHQLKVLARSATGQKITVYTSVVNGPRRRPAATDANTQGIREQELDQAPEEVHVVLLDNGRSTTLAGEQAEILTCIRCGACLNACPVFHHIGGHAYGDVYPGPMGSVLTPELRGASQWSELPQASSLCGACRDVCPVRIDLPRMLLELRWESAQRAAKSGGPPTSQRLAMKVFAFVATRPRLMRLVRRVGGALARRFAKDGWLRRAPGLLAGWTAHRDLLAPKRDSFDDWWARRGRE
jgi:L-lactate dehydrogenase complex protein LldF